MKLNVIRGMLVGVATLATLVMAGTASLAADTPERLSMRSEAMRVAESPRQTGSADLSGTSWPLVKFQGSDDTTLTPDDKSKYTIAFGSNGRVTARIDCNRGMGSLEIIRTKSRSVWSAGIDACDVSTGLASRSDCSALGVHTFIRH